MYNTLATPEFKSWFGKLKDDTTRARLSARIRRVENGNFGDAKPVGKGVSELRIQFGPGYRIYFQKRGDVVIVLLCGGDKGSQSRDIELAIRLSETFKDETP
jgi:putative addiction module killer protein